MLVFWSPAMVNEVLPPSGGQRHALRLIHQLVRPDRKFSPGATNLAGVLDRVAQTIRRRSLVRTAYELLSGHPRTDKALYAHDVDRLEIVCDVPMPLQADGEDLGDVTEAHFESERDALTVLV